MKHHRPFQPSTNATPAAQPRPRLGVDAASVLGRRHAMIDAGTHPLIAERLAVSAGENQALRDRHPRFAAPAAAEMAIDEPF